MIEWAITAAIAFGTIGLLVSAFFSHRGFKQMKLIPPAIVVMLHSVVLFAQEAEPRQDSPLRTALITWLPFLALIALWWFFMRKLGGKRGYASNIERSQERLESIDDSLKRIASSLERLEAGRPESSPPDV